MNITFKMAYETKLSWFIRTKCTWVMVKLASIEAMVVQITTPLVGLGG